MIKSAFSTDNETIDITYNMLLEYTNSIDFLELIEIDKNYFYEKNPNITFGSTVIYDKEPYLCSYEIPIFCESNITVEKINENHSNLTKLKIEALIDSKQLNKEGKRIKEMNIDINNFDMCRDYYTMSVNLFMKVNMIENLCKLLNIYLQIAMQSEKSHSDISCFKEKEKI